jgi:osmotically-inducible protein OsmY
MPQDQRYGRRHSRYDWDDERDRDYGRGRDEWRGESRSYRSSRYEDEGRGSYDHDRRQDRDYQGTLRAGDYGRYEEEEGRSHPERFGAGGRYGGQDFGVSDRGGRYSSGGGYGGSGDRGGYGGRGYESGRSRSRDYGSGRSGGEYGNEGAGFGNYVSDYDNRYGSGGWSGSGHLSGGRYGSRSDYGNRDRDWWDRATDEVSSWFGDKDAERRRQMDEHRGRGPKNYSRSDERIREDVSDRLTDNPLVDASEIEVTVSNQEVTLSGTVRTRQQRRLAEDCAESVSGVKHVQNNIRVKDQPLGSRQPGSTGGPTTFGSGGTTTM